MKPMARLVNCSVRALRSRRSSARRSSSRIFCLAARSCSAALYSAARSFSADRSSRSRSRSTDRGLGTCQESGPTFMTYKSSHTVGMSSNNTAGRAEAVMEDQTMAPAVVPTVVRPSNPSRVFLPL